MIYSSFPNKHKIQFSNLSSLSKIEKMFPWNLTIHFICHTKGFSSFFFMVFQMVFCCSHLRYIGFLHFLLRLFFYYFHIA